LAYSDFKAASLLRLLPAVLRARDFHLYLEGGKRLVDLWRWGGRAILGHKPPKVLLELKNAAERGLFCPLPHPMERRFFKALRGFFPDRAFRLYLNENSLYQALASAGFSSPPHDPAFPSRNGARANGEMTQVSIWRPFLDNVLEAPGFQQPPAGILVPVLPFAFAPAVLVLPQSMENTFPPGELIPPAVLAPAARSLFNLAAALKTFNGDQENHEENQENRENRLQQMYPKVRRALAKSIWRRRSIYLTVQPNMNDDEYTVLFKRFFEDGFLIPPSPSEPAVLPLAMSAGEEAKLAGLL
jgi:hypothetical protein